MLVFACCPRCSQALSHVGVEVLSLPIFFLDPKAIGSNLSGEFIEMSNLHSPPPSSRFMASSKIFYHCLADIVQSPDLWMR
eukprot:209241-Ditylum_brightwellii.AAC.1